MAESSENAVESCLHKAAESVIEARVDILQKWRNVSLEGLVEWTTPGSIFQDSWAEKGPGALTSLYRAR